MGRLGVARGLDLVFLRSGESNAKQADNVSIGSSAINGTFNDRLLFADKRAELVASHVHTVEVGETVVALNILNTKLDLSVGLRLVLLEVRERNFNHTSLEVFRGNLGSLCLGNESLSAVLSGKDGRSNQLVPFLLGEGINGLFAASLLGLCQSLVLSLLGENAQQKQTNCEKTEF